MTLLGARRRPPFRQPKHLADEALAVRVASRTDSARADADVVAGAHDPAARCARPRKIRCLGLPAHRDLVPHIVDCRWKSLKSKRQRADRPRRTSRLLSCRPVLPNFCQHRTSTHNLCRMLHCRTTVHENAAESTIIFCATIMGTLSSVSLYENGIVLDVDLLWTPRNSARRLLRICPGRFGFGSCRFAF